MPQVAIPLWFAVTGGAVLLLGTLAFLELLVISSVKIARGEEIDLTQDTHLVAIPIRIAEWLTNHLWGREDDTSLRARH